MILVLAGISIMVVVALLVFVMSFLFSAASGGTGTSQTGFSILVPVSWTFYSGSPATFSLSLTNDYAEEIRADFSSDFFKISSTDCATSIARVEAVKNDVDSVIPPVEAQSYSVPSGSTITVEGSIEQAEGDSCEGEAGDGYRFEVKLLNSKDPAGEPIPDSGFVSGKYLPPASSGESLPAEELESADENPPLDPEEP